MFNPYKYIQAFSIDIVLGGVIGAMFIAKYLGVSLDFFMITELALIIWLIYTFDHLTDSGSGLYDLVTFRHKVHKRFAVSIWGIWSFTLVVAFSLLFKIPMTTLMGGSILAFFVILYFISLKLLEGISIYHKEISAAIIYVTGIFVGPVSIYQESIGLDLWMLFVEFILLALINLLIFSMFEQSVDMKSGFQSLVKSIGSENVLIITISLLVIVILLSLTSMIIDGSISHILEAQLIMIVMASAFTMIFINRRRLIINERYRMYGDAVFFIPVLFIFL